MIVNMTDMIGAFPEVFLLLMASVTLVAGMFFSHQIKTITYYFSLVSLLAVFVYCVIGFGNQPLFLFHNVYLTDDFACLFKGMTALIIFSILIYSKQYLLDSKMLFNEFHVLTLFCTLGMFVMASANSLLAIYLGLELMSLPLYVLIALKKDDFAIEASIKYFVMGAIASCIILFGMSLLFGAFGTLDISKLSSAMSAANQSQFYVSFALIFILLGIAFKLALAPLHMWAPDVYDGAPGPVVSVLSSAPKLAVIALFFRLIMPIFQNTEALHSCLIFLSVFSIIIGNLFALMQTNLKKLLAYSTVSHMGYILFGILAGNDSGYSAAVFYALTYAITAAATFGLMTLLSKEGNDVREIRDLSGLNEHSPWFAFLFLILLFSMAGVPPTAGFIAKLLVLKAVIDVNLLWLAVIGVVFAILGAFYYIRVVKEIYFSQEDETRLSPKAVNVVTKSMVSVHALALLVLGVLPSLLMGLTSGLFA